MNEMLWGMAESAWLEPPDSDDDCGEPTIKLNGQEILQSDAWHEIIRKYIKSHKGDRCSCCGYVYDDDGYPVYRINGKLYCEADNCIEAAIQNAINNEEDLEVEEE